MWLQVFKKRLEKREKRVDRPEYTYFEEAKFEKLAYNYMRRAIFAFLIIMTIVTTFATLFHARYYYFVVSGPSMQGTLNPDPDNQGLQDAVIVDKYKKVDYGDIIIINRAKDDPEKTSIVKRLIAFEGDYVTIKAVTLDNGKQEFRVFVKKAGEDEIVEMQEDYIDHEKYWPTTGYTFTYQGVTYEKKFFDALLAGGYDPAAGVVRLEGDPDGALYYKIPKGEFFFMGDHRNISKDSRSYDFKHFKYEQIVGSVCYISHNANKYRPATAVMVGNWRMIFDLLLNFFKV